MTRFLTMAAAALLFLTTLGATANAFDYSSDDDGDEDNAADFAYEMSGGGYQELQEDFENGEFNPPFDEEDDDEEDNEDDDSDEVELDEDEDEDE